MDYQPNPTPAPRFSLGKRELTFGIVTAVLSIGLWNSILYGGFHLGYSLFSLALLGCSVWYLQKNGSFGWYEWTLIAFAALLTAGFARSSDVGMKLVLVPASIFAANLGLCLAAGQNRRSRGGFGTVFDAPRAFFTFGFGGMGAAARGMTDAWKNSGTAGKKGSAALLGVVIAVPVVAVMVPLLIRSDAAFEGFMGQLPETDWTEPFWSAALGLFAAWVLFARGVGLISVQKGQPAKGITKRLSPITVNILLGAVCILYLTYLFSQLGYFFGGFLWSVPKEYTLAEYARRGFFEMAWLSAINLTLILSCAGLVEQEEKLPGLTRLMCFFLGGITLFLIAAASAKMLLYIDSYGLTRLRVLTQTVMIWLGISTLLVCARLVKPKLAYMKGVILVALVLGTALLWLDVDTMVARYNVRAYQQGTLETVDMSHLSTLGYGAVPYIAELTQDEDAWVAQRAKDILLLRRSDARIDDLRDWNLSEWMADRVPFG